MVKLLQIFSSKYGKTFTWKYVATSHGKGVVDGIGGNIKRLVRIKTMPQGEAKTVQSAEDLANVVESLNTKANVLYVSTQQIADLIEEEMSFACVVPENEKT